MFDWQIPYRIPGKVGADTRCGNITKGRTHFLDSWTNRIDRIIWDSLKGKAIPQSYGRQPDQEFSRSLTLEAPAREQEDYESEEYESEPCEPESEPQSSEPEEGGPEDHALGSLRLHDLDHVVQAKLNRILADSGPLESILAHLLSTKGKFFRPKMVISSAYACLPYTGNKTKCVRCSTPPAQLRAEQNSMNCTGKASGSTLGGPDFDDEKIDMVTDIAAAFEMVHLASLVHDDIIDGSTHRRGLPTIHLTWGIHSAVLAGDYLFSEANNTVLKYAGLGIASCLTDAVGLMCRGEVAQDSRFYDPSVNVSDYFYQTARKTAALIAAGCKAGAMAARAPIEVQERLWRFGIRVGTAFQIIDDILDIVSDGKALGKPVFSDLRRGILTLPLIYAMEGEVGRDILECLSNKAVPDHTIPGLRRKLISGGHVKKAGEVACILLDSARQDLGGLPASQGRADLRDLSHKLAQKARDLSLGSPTWR